MIITAFSLLVQASSAALSFFFIVIALAPARNIVVAVFSALTEFINAVVLGFRLSSPNYYQLVLLLVYCKSIWWFSQTFYSILEHKLYLSVKRHDVVSLFKDLCLLPV
ncbi:uncharacterized protein CIMG_13128 [Coccidioides immitis RS]|uniref:Uncharacterized protein n=1 Tax=Coccidioides immitis (strain RS) TaxID=246410 RepID=J3K9Y2_COCIM|nr:uncharacterized protein CIMG_13128 [Coccidioides immitis RS]EAS31770.3 hypothetical protein CIMG_13128 [Coccidioides immitis RS]